MERWQEFRNSSEASQSLGMIASMCITGLLNHFPTFCIKLSIAARGDAGFCAHWKMENLPDWWGGLYLQHSATGEGVGAVNML